MLTSRLWPLLTTPALALTLVACSNDGGGASESPAPTTSQPTTSAPTPTPRPSVQPTKTTQKYGPLTLVLDHTAPPPANAKAALQAYEGYERSAHRSQATNVEDPAPAKYGVGGALQVVRDSLRGQNADGVRTGGVISIKVKLVRASAAVAAFSGCYDQSKSLLVRANGTSYTGPLTMKYPQLLFKVIVTNAAGLWRVTEYDLTTGNC